jgi:precorrin-6A/cobalt-precorrin-6A reductase
VMPSSPMPTMDSQRCGGQFARSTAMATPLRVLILGGTAEASALARLIAGDSRFEATLSLAGRTSEPRPQPLATRIGGFGGADGLARFLGESAVDVVIDATHPYADQISANAFAACGTTGVPLVSIARPMWQAQPGDQWHVVRDADEAATALGAVPRRVFLSLGRLDLHAFAPAPQHHYVARIIDPPQQEVLPPDLRFLQARGPFDRTAETRLLEDKKIEVVVSKNSGGAATYPKIEAARDLSLPVVMIARPEKAAGRVVHSAEEAIVYLEQRLHDALPSLRGV